MNALFTFHSSGQGAWQLSDPDARLRRHQHRLAILFGLATATIVAIAGAAIGLNHTEYDARGCTVGARAPQAVTVLIDHSNTFSMDQNALVAKTVQRRADALGIGDLLSLFTLARSADGQPLTEGFSRCRPSRGREVSIWNDQPTIREAQYQEQFKVPLDTALDRALQASESDTSPLLEALQAIAQSPSFQGGGQGRTLVLYTDGLQKSSLASFFKQGYGYDKLAQQGSIYLSGLRERFASACVEMYIVTTHFPRQVASPEFERFWREYWQAAGVQCLTFARI